MAVHTIGLTSIHQYPNRIKELMATKQEILVTYRGKIICKLAPPDALIGYPSTVNEQELK